MYEDLIKALRHCCVQNRCNGCPFFAIDKQTKQCAKMNTLAADAIEELMRRCEQFQYMPPPAWIPVTERLPSYGDWVLGIGPKNGYYVCEYRGMSHFVYGGDSPWFSSKGKAVNITHWMPLPEPPKEK